MSQKETKSSKYSNEIMDFITLKDMIPLLQEKLDKIKMDRNFVQLEKDAIQQYYNITQLEIKELELAIQSKQCEMEEYEEKHRIEIKIYQQKVKHLEYENMNNIDIINDSMNQLINNEKQLYQKKEELFLTNQEELKFHKMELLLSTNNKSNEMKLIHDKQIIKLKSQFENSLKELIKKCKLRIKKLQYDLELHCRVEIHEVEERKNQFINDLIVNHNISYNKMKSYYNDITSSNIQLILELKNKIKEYHSNAIINKNLLIEYHNEYKRLSQPLTKVTLEIKEYQNLLRERSKDQMALRNSKAKLLNLKNQINDMEMNIKKLSNDYMNIIKEKEELYITYENTLIKVKQQSNLHHQSLQEKLSHVELSSNQLAIQINEIIKAANQDISNLSMDQMVSNIHEVLQMKVNTIDQLKFNVIKQKKVFNDTMDIVYKKLQSLGLSTDEMNQQLFSHFKVEDLPEGVSSGPIHGVI